MLLKKQQPMNLQRLFLYEDYKHIRTMEACKDVTLVSPLEKTAEFWNMGQLALEHPPWGWQFKALQGLLVYTLLTLPEGTRPQPVSWLYRHDRYEWSPHEVHCGWWRSPEPEEDSARERRRQIKDRCCKVVWLPGGGNQNHVEVTKTIPTNYRL